jgi:hypothetical protein
MYYEVCDELQDISVTEAMRFMMRLFLTIASAKLFLSEEEVESLLALFVAALPEALKSKLKKRVQTAS